MSRISSLSQLREYTFFRSAIMNLAVNSPDEFYRLLTDIRQSPAYNISYDRVEHPFERLYDRHVSFGVNGEVESLVPVSDEKALERFAQRSAADYAKAVQGKQEEIRRFSRRGGMPSGGADRKFVIKRECPSHIIDQDLEDVIFRLHRSRAAEAVIFLLEHAIPDVRKAFIDNFLSPEELAQRAEVDIVVRPIKDNNLIRGNLGRYAIFARKNSEEIMLRFTHQASCVYYLMFLVSRRQGYGVLEPLSLGANREEFMNLYHEVYDIPQSTLEDRFKKLLYREENGRERIGRVRELIYDIRKHVEAVLDLFDESAAPYVMTAFRHLTIGRGHIVFEGDELLKHRFK